ncbi:glycosyltransferase [Williamsia muralis]|uniref:glycosyltransferase n=1 Tax=Williamsia marianensis TaxID=85044 RepID=UPI0037FD3151
MKVLHIVPLVSDSAEYGGPVRGTGRQCTTLAERGNECHILGLWRGDGPIPRQVLGVQATLFEFRRLPGHRFATALSFPAIKWVRSNARNYDCVHVHSGRDLWILIAIKLIARAGVPVVWQTHGMLANRVGRVYKLYDGALTRPAIKASAAMLYLTPYEKRDIESVGIPNASYHIVNGVDDASEKGPRQYSEELRVAFVSRIHPRKRLNTLIEAVDRLVDRGMRVRLDIYGPDEGALSDALNMVKDKGIEKEVTYFGALHYSEVRKVLEQYDVMVLPSVDEPFPNIVLESLATGTAVVITTSCGLAPYVERYAAGLVVDTTVDGIVAALTRLIVEPELNDDLTENGRILVTAEFAMDSVAKSLETVYGEAKI